MWSVLTDRHDDGGCAVRLFGSRQTGKNQKGCLGGSHTLLRAPSLLREYARTYRGTSLLTMSRCSTVAGFVGLVGLSGQTQAFVGSPVLGARALSSSTSNKVCVCLLGVRMCCC